MCASEFRDDDAASSAQPRRNVYDNIDKLDDSSDDRVVQRSKPHRICGCRRLSADKGCDDASYVRATFQQFSLPVGGRCHLW
jgi:hypothetical protein